MAPDSTPTSAPGGGPLFWNGASAPISLPLPSSPNPHQMAMLNLFSSLHMACREFCRRCDGGVCTHPSPGSSFSGLLADPGSPVAFCVCCEVGLRRRLRLMPSSAGGRWLGPEPSVQIAKCDWVGGETLQNGELVKKAGEYFAQVCV